MTDEFWMEEMNPDGFWAGDGMMRGEPGPYYTPHVAQDGTLSWTNNGNLPNPEPQNIKGPDGKSAYEQAVEGGYEGTEEEFNAELAAVAGATEQIATNTQDVSDLKSASELFDEYLKGTTQAVNFANGKPSSIVHTKNGSTVRTDSFVWGDNSVTETRTLADGSYITIATNLDTLVTVISDIQGGS